MPVTLIDKKVAKEGYTFIHYGTAEECAECRLSKACVENLEAGRRYRIVAVREQIHTCAVCGEAAVVEVEEAEVEAGMEKRRALIGATLAFSPVKCDRLLCENYIYCVPEGLRTGDHVVVSQTGKKLKCERGLALVKVALQRVAR